MKHKDYKISLNFVTIPENEQKERADRITSILIKGARLREELKRRLIGENRAKD